MQALMEIGTHKVVQGKMSHGVRRRRRKAAARAGTARRAELEREMAEKAAIQEVVSRRQRHAQLERDRNALAIGTVLSQIRESTNRLRELFADRIRRVNIELLRDPSTSRWWRWKYSRRETKLAIIQSDLHAQLATHRALKRQLADLRAGGPRQG